MKLTFTGSKQLEGDVRTFTFHSETPVSWIAGQFLHLTLPHDNQDDRGDERWFTISSAPVNGKLAISTRIVAEHPSSFKQTLASLQLGDIVEADMPEGDFTLGDPVRNYVFIAGGIGVTPFHSIITEAAAQHAMPQITLLYANRTAEVTFKEEFETIRIANPSLQITYLYAPQKIDKDLLQKTIESIDDPLVYVSGPEPMVEAFVKDLEEIGLSEENVKTDYFPGYEAF